MQIEKSYIQKYNETHYRQINMRVSEEIAVKFDELKPKFGSAPKLLLAGLEALENQNNLEIEMQNLKAENQKLKEVNEGMFKKGQQKLDEKNQKIKALNAEIARLKSRSLFDYLFGWKSERGDK